MTKTEKVPILGIFSPKTILMIRIGLKIRVGRPTGTTHTFHLSLKGNSLYCLISPDLFICIWNCTKTISSDKASIDISDMFKLLSLFKKMWKYPSDNCTDPKL